MIRLIQAAIRLIPTPPKRCAILAAKSMRPLLPTSALTALFVVACSSDPPPASVDDAAASSTAGAAATAEEPPATTASATSAPSATPAPTATVSATASAKTAPFDVAQEDIGGLRLSATEADLVKKLGKPKSKTKPQLEQGTGEHASSWTWADGFSATMTSAKAKGPFSPRLLMIAAPSKAKTSRGIGIGSTRAEVEKAYAGVIDREISNPTMIVVGEAIGGLKLHFDDKGAVRSIALGSDAE